MKKLIDKYTDKIISQGLADRSGIILIGLDAEKSSNVPLDKIDPELIAVFDRMNISSLLYAEPAEPYRSILAFLSGGDRENLVPADCETRTFLHDIPIIDELSTPAICSALSSRKAAIVNGRGIISYGTVSPEQAFVSFSSVCFSTYIKFFIDFMFHLEDSGSGRTRRDDAFVRTFNTIENMVKPVPGSLSEIPGLPPRDEDEVSRQLIATGKELVNRRLVDSYFGNISYILGNIVYISQTGSSLDELSACIDAVPLDGSSSSGITASSELSAHIGIFRKTGLRAILHGHPKFTVIMSMSCRKDGCEISACYRSCREERTAAGVPVVSGEIGTGPTGLVRTVPEALSRNSAAIVFGHGIFAAAADAFRPAFDMMLQAENRCMQEYFTKIRGLI